MKLLNTLIIGGSILLMATSCNNNETQYDNPCDELDAVDLEMNNKVKEIQNKYANEKSFMKRFNSAQVQWIQYKNRHLDSVYPLQKEMYKKEYGQDYNDCKCKEAIKLTKLRNIELARWLESTNEIDNCPSSWK